VKSIAAPITIGFFDELLLLLLVLLLLLLLDPQPATTTAAAATTSRVSADALNLLILSPLLSKPL
jgi:hypothetical protein